MLLNDVRYALRVLIKSPGFSLTALAALALGIGANTAIFSVVNAVLLQPLAYREPDRLVLIWQHLANSPKFGALAASAPDYVDYRDRCRTMDAVAGFTGANFNLTGRGTPQRVNGVRVGANLFPMLGVRPALGRTFLAEEDQPGRNREILLSYGAWQRRFGADIAVVGKTAVLDGVPHTIVGVMPKGFDFPPQGFRDFVPGEFWTPLALTKEQLDNRGDNFNVFMLARLKPGVAPVQAAADAKAVAHQITLGYPPQFQGPMAMSASVEPLMESITGRIRTSLLVIFGAVAFVLLIGCANVANLLLAKASARSREIAVRAAIGASRRRILRQLLTESIVLALAGGALGIFVGTWTTSLLIRFSPGNVPRLAQAQLDVYVLAFTLAISVLTGIGFGIAPALRACGRDLDSALKEGGRGNSAGLRRNGVLGGLVVGEIALALTLLIGAGLLVRTFLNLRGVSAGFHPEHVLSAALTLPPAKYPNELQVKLFYDELVRRVEALPGVASAAVSTGLPLRGDWRITVTAEGEPPSAKAFKTAAFEGVTPGYHKTLEIELKRGRLFKRDDRANTTAVAIVNETMARHYWPNQDALGKRFKWGPPESTRPWLQIAGIVADVKQSSLEEPPPPTVYLPYSQMPKLSTERTGRNVFLAIRTAAEPAAEIASVRHVVAELDPDLPLFAIRDMESVLAGSIAPQRFNALLVAAFAAVAMLLAAIGIYGVMSYSVRQYRHEIGVRMALGAAASDVVSMLLREGMRLILAGVVLGLAGAFAVTRLMTSLLFEIKPADPLTFGVVSAALAAVAVLSVWLPARRAARVDPMAALRYE